MGMMSWLRRLTGQAPAPDTAPVREAVKGVTIDRDEDQWRRLTGDANRDLSPLSVSRTQELAVYLWRSNPIANRLVELPLAYLLAEGVAVESDDPEVQGWIDAFWHDPINAMPVKLPKLVRELAIYGEQCWPVFVNDVNGAVRLGYLDPGLIETVVTDPDNVSQPIGVVTRRDKRGRARRFRVIVNGPEDVFTERTREIRAGFADGECFFFRVNDLSSGTRGQSDLAPQADWLDGYDQALFGELDRWDFQRAFVWDVSMRGATQEQVDQRAKSIGVPSPGSVRVHNDAEEWKAVTPQLGSADTEKFARLFRNHIIGGASLPEHWYGGGGDVNRNTAQSMAEPTFKIFSLRQTLIGHMLVECATYVVRQRFLAYYGAEPTGEEWVDRRPRCSWPELTSKDTSSYAAALAQVVQASIAAINAGLLSQATAVDLISSIGERLGVQIDVETELEGAAADAAAEADRDRFGGPADPDKTTAAQPLRAVS